MGLIRESSIIDMPSRSGNEGLPEAKVASKTPGALSGRRILCVGEDMPLLHVRRLLLEHEGYYVQIQRLETLAAFKPAIPFDLAILCHSLQQTMRVQLVAWLRQNFPQVPILLLEGSDSQEVQVDLPHSSTRPQDLLDAISRWIRGSQHSSH